MSLKYSINVSCSTLALDFLYPPQTNWLGTVKSDGGARASGLGTGEVYMRMVCVASVMCGYSLARAAWATASCSSGGAWRKRWHTTSQPQENRFCGQKE